MDYTIFDSDIDLGVSYLFNRDNVYYLETGDILDNKITKKRSKRAVFFRFVASTPRWRFLEPYETLLNEYEERFRTSEYHKNSVLRVELLGGRKVDPNALLSLLNKATTNVWPNLLSIVGGGKATSFNELHQQGEPEDFGPIDPKYLE